MLHEMSLAMEKSTASQSTSLPLRSGERQDAGLAVTVVFTSLRGTLAALKSAAALASTLNANINLVVLQIVPYPLPLASPPVLLDFSEKRFRAIADGNSVATTVLLYLCRDREETLPTILKPRSLVVIGGRRRWWPNPERRLARNLRRAGHEVIFTETE